MGEMIQKNEYDELKDKYDELKQLLLTLQREKNLFEESYGDVSARLVEAQKDRDMYKDLYNGLNVKNGKLISENAKLKDDLAHCNKLLKEMEANYDEASDRNAILVKEMDKLISENAKLKEDYNKLVDENKSLTETLDKLRTKKPDDCENKWATHEEAKKFFESLQQEPIKLSPVFSEVPNMVINTKNLYLTFDNHTNNFKEDDTND